jgi:hypothetical protein
LELALSRARTVPVEFVAASSKQLIAISQDLTAELQALLRTWKGTTSPVFGDKATQLCAWQRCIFRPSVLICKSPARLMSIPLKPYVKPQAPTKDQLRSMLAEAVRNTQPEINLKPEPVLALAPKLMLKRRGRPPKRISAKPMI